MRETGRDRGELLAQAVAWGVFALFWVLLLAYFVAVLSAV